jgi:very-short-patch-repair endonuclease
VFRPSFLKSRGWNIIRIWSRDYWMHKSKVLSMIVKEIEKSKANIIKNSQKAKSKTTQK